MSKQPWMKFYPADWRADPAIKVTSLAARGLWIEMLALMHEADPRGSLLVKGKIVSPLMLAALVGSDEITVSSLLQELEENGVYSRKKNGVIYSRRMELDENKARKNRENGKMGGNPSLCSETEKQESVNPKDKAKKLEARSQSKKIEANASPKKNGNRLSSGWNPSEEDRTFASAQGFGSEAIRFEADRFRDFWISKAGNGGVKLDWAATWRNWIRNSNGRGRGQPQAAKPRTVLDVIRENREKEQENEFTIDHEPEYERGSGAVVHFASISQGRKS